MGTLVTDHTLIKAGALHRANGGYLLLEARDVLEDPVAWTVLKKALKSGRIRIEEPDEEGHAITALMLQPQPVPLDVKVVLVGARDLYEYVYAMDEEFRELFKVRVDFDDSLDRSPDAERLFGRFVAGACRDLKLRPFDAPAVGRLVEHAARIVEHQARLSARFGDLVDVLREADHLAGARGAGVVGAEDVQAAIDHRRRRSSLLEERLHRMTEEGTLLIATTGEAVGQVNGLEVLATGDYEFGRPFRITARARPGKPGVVDVEREVGLGGAIHAKGVLILSGYLGGHYLIDRPLAMSASIVAEQSYDPMEGDSASLAETCALLSALARRPLTQHLAVSGSINQHGQVQAVGGINEKIEGFFDLCRERGLTGHEGVIVPQANVRHLMLRHDVVEAAREGRFRVMAVSTVDEAIGALTGADAGSRSLDGQFPEGSFNAAVEQRLGEFAAAVERQR
jgi:predicted ATP-dependent protease